LQKSGAPGLQPLVTGAPGDCFFVLPVAAEALNVHNFRGNRIGRINLKVLEFVGTGLLACQVGQTSASAPGSRRMERLCAPNSGQIVLATLWKQMGALMSLAEARHWP
jgi:hypothetical protein